MPQLRIIPLAVAVLVGCGDHHGSESGFVAEEQWISESAYEFGGALDGDALFGRIHVRVAADGQRVFVLEPFESRVSVWTPAGRRLLDLGGTGQGPGDFMFPYRIDMDESGFLVRDQQRFSYFSHEGKLLRTVPNPPASVGYQGFPITTDVLLADGSFLGIPNIPASVRLGLWGDDPMNALPVLRIHESGQQWLLEEVYTRNVRNLTLAVPLGDGYYFAAQPYSDADWHLLDRETGSVVVARLTGDDLQAGEVELIEASASGETVWRRRLGFRPIRLGEVMVDNTIDGLIKAVNREEEITPGILGGRSARDLAREALYVPEYLPSLAKFVLTSSGEAWLQTRERSDSLSVWYSIKRGNEDSPPRRVLLPNRFALTDATATHVWGVLEDELGTNYVAGRRLVPSS